MDFFEKKPFGLFSLLDEEIIVPQGSDVSLLQKLEANHKKSEVFSIATKHHKPNLFVVKHFAGDVCYNIAGFVEKNKDLIHPHFYGTMQSPATKNLVANLFEEIEQFDSKRTLLTHFRNQLTNLMQNISDSKVHYIRCLAPNLQK